MDIVGDNGGVNVNGLSTDLLPGQIYLINGGRYLVVETAAKPQLESMSPAVFRRLDDGTFCLCCFYESHLQNARLERQLSADEYVEQLRLVECFLETHRAWLEGAIEKSKNGSGTFLQ